MKMIRRIGVMMAALAVAGTAWAAKTEVTPPTVASKVYNGEKQTADVVETAEYKVKYNGGGTHASTYKVYLELKDPDNYCWPDTTKSVTSVDFTITKAGNEWIVAPSITGWTYGETPHVATAEPRYGNLTVTYDGTLTDGTEVKDQLSVKRAGSYVAKFTVADCTDYAGLSASIPFTIARGTIDVGGGGSGGAVVTTKDFRGPYDRTGHCIDIQVTGDDISTFVRQYGSSAAGPFTIEKPLYTNACDETVWFVLTSPDYLPITNSAAVVITNRCVTMKSTDGTWVWDGKEHSTNAVIVSVMDESGPRGARTLPGGMVELLEGETVETTFYKKWSEVGAVSNDFSIAWTGTAKESNYNVTLVTGKLEIVAAPDVTVMITAQAKTNVYDGIEHRNDGFTWTANNPLFTAEDFSFSGCSNLASIAVCDLKMNLKPGDFALQGSHFSGASFVIAQDGTLVITNATPVTPEGPIDPIDPDPEDPTKPFSKYDFIGIYDGAEHTIDTNALAKVTYQPAAALTFSYALTKDGAYQSSPFAFKDVVTTSFWYKISAPNFADFVHQAKVTIAARDIAHSTIAPIAAVEYAGVPVTPVPTVTDGNPSIITTSDYTVSYANNNAPGTATLTLTGKGNYTGTKSANFTIEATAGRYAALKGTLVWKLNLGSGCYTAQLKLTCTNGLSQGISNLRFVYQDRTSGSAIASALYNSSARTYRPTANYSGTTYRYVDLDASKVTSENVAVLYGVKDVSQAKGVIPASECLIELYVRSLASPVSDLGYVVWTSNGTECMLPITASGESQGMTVKNVLKVAKLAASASMLSAPLSMNALNTSLALGVVLDPASTSYCKLTDFAVGDGGISGHVEVGKESAGGVQTQGALGTNARAVLMGAKNLTDGFAEIGSVTVDDSGAFRFSLGSGDYQFFRVRIDAENVVE